MEEEIREEKPVGEEETKPEDSSEDESEKSEKTVEEEQLPEVVEEEERYDEQEEQEPEPEDELDGELEEEEEEEEPFVSIFEILDAPRELPDPVDLTAALVKRMRDRLGIIELCWPEITEASFEGRTVFPDSYLKNGDKEKLLLLYCENFRRQFDRKFPHRKPLLLAAENECGIQKMVCTTLRPTCCPNELLRDWQTCAKFLADLIVYEPLAESTLLPTRLFSPNTVVRRLKAGPFDLANLLCSVLLGAGFNCYLVSGYACLDVTSKVQVRFESPHPEMPEDDGSAAEEAREKRYRVLPPRDLRSKFILMMEQRKVDEVRRAEEEQLEILHKAEEELEKPSYDALQGQRKHAWVLVFPGPRNPDDQPFFLEPSTGTRYEPSCPFYSGIESVWNHVNYWVNLQEEYEDLSQLDYDLTNQAKWEHLLIGEPLKSRKLDVGRDAEEEEVQMMMTMDEKHLDLPYPWPEPVVIDYKLLADKFPGGKKFTRYNKTEVEEFAEYVQEDGLVTRVARYRDFFCSPEQRYAVEEHYANRLDMLHKVIRNLETGEVTEYYENGRDDQAKKHRYQTGSEFDLERPRLIEYFVQSRYDGLIKIELTDTKMTEYYQERSDRLFFRETTYCVRGEPPPGYEESHRRIIAKILEKFGRDESAPATRDISIREFCMMESEIRLKFHYEKGCVTATTRIFVKPPISEMGENLAFNPERTYGYVSEIGVKPPSALYLYTLLMQQIKEEEVSVYAIRDMEDQLGAFLRLRMSELASPTLRVSLFNRHHNRELLKLMRRQELEQKKVRQREVEEDMDYLAPCFAKLGLDPHIKHLNYPKACAVRELFRELVVGLLVGRANDIQASFERTTQELAERHAWYASVQDTLTLDESESYFQEIRDKSFYLHTLEIRLARHRDLSNSRYEQWMGYMSSDPRMLVLLMKERKPSPPAVV